jgi:hypothetical protein
MNDSGSKDTSSTCSTHVRDNLVPVSWLALLKYDVAGANGMSPGRGAPGDVGTWTVPEGKNLLGSKRHGAPTPACCA